MNEKTLKARIKRAEALAEDIAEKRRAYERERASIVEAMNALGLAEERAGNIRARLSRFSRVQLDAKRMKSEAPDIYNRFTSTREETRLTFTEI